MISVIIPTYTAVDCLKLCLESAIKNQKNNNEFIIVVDGNPDLYKDVLYSDRFGWTADVTVLTYDKNVGLAVALNAGVYQAKHENILVVNDDNVFPPNWDEILETYSARNNTSKYVTTCNQIEPYPSMFESTIVHNLGTNPNEFNLEEFNNVVKKYNKYGATLDGSTFPFFMSKKMYMACGGWDTQYPGPHIVDWDFFLKLELLGMKFRRIHDCNFYHFVAQSTKLNVNNDTCNEFNKREGLSWRYFEHKWGFPPRNLKDNLKSPKGDIYKGIKF